jgi:glycosyltransferase involved in cell wall biosynthesis
LPAPGRNRDFKLEHCDRGERRPQAPAFNPENARAAPRAGLPGCIAVPAIPVDTLDEWRQALTESDLKGLLWPRRKIVSFHLNAALELSIIAVSDGIWAKVFQGLNLTSVEQVLVIVFVTAIALILWSYVGYPIFLWLCSKFIRRHHKTEEWTPPVTLIITAHNEERRIAQKIDNALGLDYPPDKLNILVVSDASTDKTEEIIRSYSDRGVRLMIIPERHGKHYGQGKGAAAADTEIVVLSDATTFLRSDAVRLIVQNYADPTIGCVSGCDAVREQEDSSAGEGAYVRYEMALRRLESRVSSIIGASGSFFSVRKSLCSDWIDDMSSDFYLPISSYMRGFRSVLDERSIGYYSVLHDPAREFQRKLRTIVHGLEVLFHFKAALNPFRYGLFAIQLLSHKLFRWLVPFALIAALVTNVFLLQLGLVFEMLLVLQAALYLLALGAYLIKPIQGLTTFKIPLFFVMVNMSILVAWYKYLTGVKYVVWKATER